MIFRRRRLKPTPLPHPIYDTLRTEFYCGWALGAITTIGFVILAAPYAR